MATYNNKALSRIFVTYHSQNCWAYLAGVGWRKARTGNTDGVTNMNVALVAARANNRTVTVKTNSGDSKIEQVYL